MEITLHLLKATGRLNNLTEKITSIFNESVGVVTPELTLGNVDVVIWDNPRGAIPEIGIGGRTQGPNTVFVAINPEFNGLDKTIGVSLKNTLIHEFHHCARWGAIGYGRTLLKALVSEGLADHFQVELTGELPPPWCSALSDEETLAISNLARSDYDNDKYDHDSWFFGNKDLNIPRWSGYTLGYKMVADYLKYHPNESAASLTATEAKMFVNPNN